ncbi:MAG TPA: CPBP family intramembrane glutamic endopeptidase [Candidatus Methylomirabilis sp.]|nr:CPBP family intramembrane glutamic endopeptidase [Candidatus Methylomirabilis sp.]
METSYNSRMISPFPSGLAPGAARRQAGVLLALFYASVYGGGILFGGMGDRLAAPILSALVLGLLMLLVTGLYVRRDASWRESLGLGRQTVGSTLGWSLLGFVGTYVVNLVFISAYLSMQGNLEAIAAQRATWLGKLAEVPTEAIFPLAAFAAIWEETVFRGFLLGRLRASLPAGETRHAAMRRDALAVVLTALCFGAGHGYQGGLGLMQTTMAGLALGGLAAWRRSIWPAIGAHLAIDAFGLVALKVLKPMLPAVANLMSVR